MVLKVSKGGVRSGNTLRALSTAKIRRYSHHACIVGRSSLPKNDLATLLNHFADDNVISSALRSTNVIMSLNKKKRWLLPATVSHMIKIGSFKEGETIISLLERHKLKRRANCVSFVCNQGRVRHVTPRQKRYFSFNLRQSGAVQSNREKKRQRTEAELLAMKEPEVKMRRGKNGELMKTINAYTVVRSGNNQVTDKNSESCKPEYSLEVVYPCPKSCSLLYNPKYTNINVEDNCDRHEEMRSSIKSSKTRRHGRKRFTFKDLLAFKEEELLSNEEELWGDDYEDEENCEDVEKRSEDKGLKNQNMTEERIQSEHYYRENQSNVSENIIANLVAEAEKAKMLCENHRLRHRKSFRSSYRNISDSSKTESRSHLIFIDDPSSRVEFRDVKSDKQDTIFLHSARVILLVKETVPDNLRAKYGHLYVEAESEPRRFAINVTEDVQNVFMPSRKTNIEQRASYMSFLIFIHDGAYDEDLDTFKVLFNSKICTDTQKLVTDIPFERTSIAEIMNLIVSSLLDVQHEDQLRDEIFSSHKSPNPVIDFVNDVLNVRIEAFHFNDKFHMASSKDSKHGMEVPFNGLRNVLRNLDRDIFCDICYADINPTQTGAVSGTQLSKCGHSFCDECWREHIRIKFRIGAIKITCPIYECDAVVDPVTLLTLLHVSDVSRILQRACQQEVETSQNCKWCPNPRCGRAVRMTRMKESKETSLDVTCACGYEFCFSCLQQPHWPATCEQADIYLEKLDSLKPLNEGSDEQPSITNTSLTPSDTERKKTKVVELEGRLCPKCLTFLQKNGGCNIVVCKCGKAFCWRCLKDCSVHISCKPNPIIVSKYTARLRVKHLFSIQKPATANTQLVTSKEMVKSSNPRQKSTMHHRALQQRQRAQETMYLSERCHIVTKIAKVAQKNLRIKRKILSYFSAKYNYTDESRLVNISLAPFLTEFLRSCTELKGALHQVTEFTFVLLRDTPESPDKRRALKLANDLNGYCCFIKSILELGRDQDAQDAVKRLVDIQTWARRALNVLVLTVNKMKC